MRFLKPPPVSPKIVKISKMRAMGELSKKAGPKEVKEIRKYLST